MLRYRHDCGRVIGREMDPILPIAVTYSQSVTSACTASCKLQRGYMCDAPCSDTASACYEQPALSLLPAWHSGERGGLAALEGNRYTAAAFCLRKAAHRMPPLTWGYEVIRGIDDDDVARVIQAFALPGANINSQVSDTSYGGYRWTSWLHLYHGDTALHLAIKSRRIEIVRALLELQPDLSIVNSHGDCASSLCGDYLGISLAELLAAEQERWRARAESERERRLREQLEAERKERRKAMVDRATYACEREAAQLMKAGKVLGTSYWGSATTQLQYDVKQGPPELREVYAEMVLLLSLDKRDSVKAQRDFRYEPLDHDGMTRLCKALSTNDNVKTLELTHCRLDTRSLIPLLAALKTNRGLTYLDLSCNVLDDGAAESISSQLSQGYMASVKSLVLSGNRITGAGGSKLVAAALSNCCELRRLVLCHNSISAEEAAHLCSSAADSGLQLDIVGCYDGEAGHDGEA